MSQKDFIKLSMDKKILISLLEFEVYLAILFAKLLLASDTSTSIES